jgi:hypothetical protein
MSIVAVVGRDPSASRSQTARPANAREGLEQARSTLQAGLTATYSNVSNNFQVRPFNYHGSVFVEQGAMCAIVFAYRLL